MLHTDTGEPPLVLLSVGSAVANGQSWTLHLYLTRPHRPLLPWLGHLAMTAPCWAWQRRRPRELACPGAQRLRGHAWGWGGHSGWGRWKVLLARGRGRAAGACPALLHRPRLSSWRKRRSDIAVLGQWARVLRAQGTWLELRAKRICHPQHQKKITAPILCPYRRSTTQKTCKIKIYKEKGEEKRKTLYLFFFFPFPAFSEPITVLSNFCSQCFTLYRKLIYWDRS